MLPKYIKNKVNSMISYSKKSNELHDQILIWLKKNGYDIELDGTDQIIVDILIDGSTQHYNSELTINSIETYLLEKKNKQ